MANNNREIEIKTPVSKHLFGNILRDLRKNAKFVKLSKQTDTYYSPRPKLFLKPKFPFEWLSIRERDGKTKLNYKHWYPEGKEKTDYCDEYETGVDDQKQLQKILKVLNFEKLVTVKKVRNVFVMNSLEIAMDEVSYLGHFVEIESVDNKGGVANTIKKIKVLAKLLGINKFVNVPGGYAAELMRRKGLMN